MSKRAAEVHRKTLETEIVVTLDLDGSGVARLDCDIPFLEHMLEQVVRHGLIDLTVSARGDLEIDAHHTVEDIGIAIGQACSQALGERKGIQRYGQAYVPLDEALSRVVLDFSGRPTLEFRVNWPRARIGEFDVDLIHEFFQGFCNHAGATLHMDSMRGANAHHVAETLFKAFGRALRAAVTLDPQLGDAVPSTKGSL